MRDDDAVAPTAPNDGAEALASRTPEHVIGHAPRLEAHAPVLGQANGANARKLLEGVIPRIGAETGTCAFGCDRALEYAVMTAPEARDPELVRKLDAVAGRVLKAGGVA